MEFLQQIGIGLVVLLIVFIIIKSNKSVEEVYYASREREQKNAKNNQGGRGEKEQRRPQMMEEDVTKRYEKVERAQHTVASDLVIKEQRKKKMSEISIWTIDAGGRLEQKIDVDHYPFTIGRGSDNDFCIEDNSVSTHHVKIVKDGSCIWMKDTGSLNKIFVNGKQTLEVPLEDGTCLFLGNTELYVEANDKERME